MQNAVGCAGLCCADPSEGVDAKFPVNSLLRWASSFFLIQVVDIERLRLELGNSLLIPCSRSKIAEFGHKSGILGRKRKNFPVNFPVAGKSGSTLIMSTEQRSNQPAEKAFLGGRLCQCFGMLWWLRSYIGRLRPGQAFDVDARERGGYIRRTSGTFEDHGCVHLHLHWSGGLWRKRGGSVGGCGNCRLILDCGCNCSFLFRRCCRLRYYRWTDNRRR